MATNTYVTLATYTIPSATASYTFTSIPQGYTDLVLVANGSTVSSSNINLRVGNGSIDSSGNNYSQTVLNGNGSSATSTRSSNQNQIQPSNDDAYWNSTVAGVMVIHFQNYSNTTTYKTILSRANHASLGVSATVGLWRSTSAINQIFFGGASQNLVAGTTLSLYGIAAEGTTPTPKATGGTIYSDANYYYHVFGATGTFTPLSSLSADVLVVAGGGGAGTNGSGGGGAGGLRLLASQSLTATGYTCTVGAGGAGIYLTTGSSGGTSSFGSISTSGGGGGGGAGNGSANAGGNGGSGGGSHRTGTAGTGNAGSYSPAEGTNGAAGGTGGGSNGGGGGGAGGAGTAGTASNGGAGGLGTSTYNSISFSSWLTATGLGVGAGLAGGGGGGGSTGFGTAVNGGGNGGLDNSAGTNATANTGGGGGGAGQSYGSAGGNGGSGVVIVRYLKA